MLAGDNCVPDKGGPKLTAKKWCVPIRDHNPHLLIEVELEVPDVVSNTPAAAEMSPA
jgi:hypothetical protein